MALERLDPIANIHQILTQASSGTVISRERLDLRNVGDPDDRHFMQVVVDTMLEMEPGNPDLLVRMNTDHNIYLIWVQGMRQPVNNGHFKLLYEMRHPVPGHVAVGNVQVFPAKGMQPMKLCVEVNPYGPIRQAQERLEREHSRRSSSHRTLPRAEPRYSAPRRVRSRSRSPIRRSYSPPPRRLSPTPARHHIPSRSPSASSESSLSPSPERSKSVLSTLLSFGGSKKPSRGGSSRRRK